MIIRQTTTFDNTFNFSTDDLSNLEIKENRDHNNCLIQDRTSRAKYYNGFILDQNTKTKIICEVAFYPSSVTSKYLPRLTFKKVDNTGEVRESLSDKNIVIAFQKSGQALVFWKFIGFLSSFKDIVDTGVFEVSFGVYSKSKFISEFDTQSEKQKVEEIILSQSFLRRENIR